VLSCAGLRIGESQRNAMSQAYSFERSCRFIATPPRSTRGGRLHPSAAPLSVSKS
jgi:hypothetical protein